MPTVPLFKRKEKLQTGGFPVVPFGAAQTDRALAGALGTAADVAGDVGDIYAAREKQRKAQNDKTASEQAFFSPGGLKDQIRVSRDEQLARKGQDAINVGTEFIGIQDKLANDFIEKIEDEDQKALVRARFNQYRSTPIEAVGNHQIAETERWNAAVARDQIDDLIVDVKESPASLPYALERAREVLKGRPLELSKAETKLEELAEETALKNLSDAVWNDSINMMLEDGESNIKDSGLPRDSKKKMLKDFRDEKTIQNKRQEDERREAQRATANEFDKKLDTLTIAEVENSNLEPGTGWGQLDYYRNKISDIAVKIKEDGVDYTSERGSNTAFYSMQSKIHTSPKSVTDEIIGEKIGQKDGYTKDDGVVLKGMLLDSLNNAARGEQLGEAISMIDALESKGLMVPDDPAENILRAQRQKDALQKLAVDNKDNPNFDPAKWVMENVKTPAEIGFFEKVMLTMPAIAIPRIAIGMALNPEAPQQADPVDPKRQQAIDLLNKNKKAVNDQTIKAVMDQL